LGGAEGDGTGIYGEPLKAKPHPEIESESEMADILTHISPNSYFHGNVQRAIWQLGDYGVAADAWRLFNHGQKFEALQDRELWVLRAEAMARIERQNLEAARTELTWEQHTVQKRLHEARVVERMRPYLRRDPLLREFPIRPAEARGARNDDLEARRERQARYVCAYCDQQGHYRHLCRHPHLFCKKHDAKLCEVSLTHKHFKKFLDDCPVRGSKTPPADHAEGSSTRT